MKNFFTVLILFFAISVIWGAVFAKDVTRVNNMGVEAIVDAELLSGDVSVFAEKNRFGLMAAKDGEVGEILVPAKYKKLIKIGKSAWIAQKGSKFGLIDKHGNYLVKAKYSHADRFFGRYAKFGNTQDFGLYNDKGEAVIQPIYSEIEPLRGNMYLVCENYKYGVLNTRGEEILANKFDNIYMPQKGQIRVKYNGEWYELNSIQAGQEEFNNKNEFTITKLVTSPMATTGYSAVTGANYALKVFSSLSPAYERTIDDLIYSQGADAAGILMNFSWIPKFPFIYAKNYFNDLKAPNNGPLSDIKESLRSSIK